MDWPKARRRDGSYLQFSVLSCQFSLRRPSGRLCVGPGISSDTNQESKSGMKGQICFLFAVAEPARGRISTKRTLVSTDKYERSR